MENKQNIELIHKDCSDKRKKNFQKTFDKYSLEVGKFVKKEFRENKEVEHMWVKITALKSNKLIGILDNEPILLRNLKLGDVVEVKFNEIEDYTK